MSRFVQPHFVAANAIVVTLCLTAPGQALAQSSSSQPDAKRGVVIAAHGTSQVPACAQCHPFTGGSDSGGAFPRIAGQSAYYLAKQMHDYTSSTRANAIMSPISKALSANEIADVAAYYASVDGQFPPFAAGDASIVEKGKQLARVGDATRAVQACNNCHAPDGAGATPAIPYLAGQYAQYISSQLQMWKRGMRNNSPESMAPIAKQLDDQQITAIAAYYQQVRGNQQAPDTTDASGAKR
jgi:cytochrome c553